MDFAHIGIDCDPGIAAEIREHFTFDVPGARFTPACRYGQWDGKIRLFKTRGNTLYAGLADEVRKFCEANGYEFVNAAPLATYSTNYVSDSDVERFLLELRIPAMFERRAYQLDGLKHVIRKRRAVLVACTASGKSLILYLITRWFKAKTLLVVPRSSLVAQMRDDFISYGCDPDSIHCITDGRKQSSKLITITTWQAIQKEEEGFFVPFRVLLGDEAHLWKATSLTGIMEKLTKCPVRVSVTGTLDGTKTNRMVLEGLFGPVHEVITTREMIDEGYGADIDIKCITLKHSPEARKAFYDTSCITTRDSRGYRKTKPPEYKTEIEYLVNCKARNDFICNLALSLKGNTLVLFHQVDEHGLGLYEDLKDAMGSRNLYLLHGGIKGDRRNEIRKLFAEDHDAILLASYGVFSTGENVPRMHNLITGHPWKGKVIVMQSLGRGLRLGEDKDRLRYYDISDDLSYKPKKAVWVNHTFKHAQERIRHYCEAELEYKLFGVDIAS